MFAKLLKYEWKSNAKLMGILSAAAAGLGILGTVVLRLLTNVIFPNSYGDNPFMALATMMFVFLLFFIFISLTAYMTAVQLALGYRFYKHKFTDEGYLTFTLPVKSRDIFLSTAVNMCIWSTISYVIMFGSFMSIMFIGTSQSELIDKELIDIFLPIFTEMFTSGEAFSEFASFIIFCIIVLIIFAISVIFSVVSIMTSVILGAVIVKKYKLLVAVGISYAMNFIISMLSSILMYLPSFLIIIYPSDTTAIVVFFLIIAIQFLLYAVLSIVGYKVSVHLMDKKLNLP